MHYNSPCLKKRVALFLISMRNVSAIFVQLVSEFFKFDGDGM